MHEAHRGINFHAFFLPPGKTDQSNPTNVVGPEEIGIDISPYDPMAIEVAWENAEKKAEESNRTLVKVVRLDVTDFLPGYLSDASIPQPFNA